MRSALVARKHGRLDRMVQIPRLRRGGRGVIFRVNARHAHTLSGEDKERRWVRAASLCVPVIKTVGKFKRGGSKAGGDVAGGIGHVDDEGRRLSCG